MSALAAEFLGLFSKGKFAAMPATQQHKKCCEMLRVAYQCLPHEKPNLEHYNELQQWLGLPTLHLPTTAKLLADRFHFHLERSEQSLKEHNLLPNISRCDRPNGAPLLPIAIYLDNVRSAHNIGSIVRTTEALRLGTIHLSEGMASIDNKQVQDAAMQCDKWIPCHQGTSLQKLPKPLICLETASEAPSIHDFIFPTSFTLVIGNEEYGCSDDTLKAADHIVQIPLFGRKNSLNVANAFSIAAAEIRRQYSLNNPSETLW